MNAKRDNSSHAVVNHLEVSNIVISFKRFAQTCHLVHRDVKPGNVRYNPGSIDESVILIDDNFIEKIGGRVIDCGTDVYRCAQSKKEKRSPFIDLLLLNDFCIK